MGLLSGKSGAIVKTLVKVGTERWGSGPLTFPCLPFPEPPIQPIILILGIIGSVVIVAVVPVVKWRRRRNEGREGAGS